MGINVLDVNPIASYGPTAQSQPAKEDLQKYFSVSRTDTAANIVKAVIGASSSPVFVTLFGSSNSNAGTTATVTINISDNSGVRSTGTVNLLTGGATTAFVQMTNLPLLQAIPPNGDFKITAQYAETGTVSTLGGPWTMRVSFAP